MNRLAKLSAALCLVMAAGFANAQAPLDTTFTYQGRLTDGGVPPADTLYDMSFELYDGSTGNGLVAAQQVGSVRVQNGLFSVPLTFGAVFGSDKRYLAIGIKPAGSGGAYTFLSQRQLITGAPYALGPWLSTPGGPTCYGPSNSYITIDSTYGDLHYNGGTDGIMGFINDGVLTGRTTFVNGGTESLVIQNGNGFVGIGTNNPVYQLHVNTPGSNVAIYGQTDTGRGVAGWATSTGWGVSGDNPTSGTFGLLGTPNEGVYGSSTNATRYAAHFANSATGNEAWLAGDTPAVFGRATSANRYAGEFLNLGNGNHAVVGGVNEAVYGAANSASRWGGQFVNTAPGGVALLVSQGLTQVKTLQILGGSDLAEPFDVNPAAAAASAAIQVGMVVIIDQEHPGQLRLADAPYDTKVAGVISGANGLEPGMVMRAEGQDKADGKYPIAMTGRVWVYCDATNGPITPGDRLTTSSSLGHAMRVDDSARSVGAVIGKAMTGLKEGKGLVLVLVNLQ